VKRMRAVFDSPPPQARAVPQGEKYVTAV
jgi:hypothetical protein